MAAAAILVFLKIQNFNCPSPVEGQFASLWQISSKSVERLRRYGDLTVSQIGGRPPSWICVIQTFSRSLRLTDQFCTTVQILVRIGLAVAEISRFFVIFKMAAAAMLVFEKFEILTVCRLQRANLRHRAKFYQNRPNGCGDMAI